MLQTTRGSRGCRAPRILLGEQREPDDRVRTIGKVVETQYLFLAQKRRFAVFTPTELRQGGLIKRHDVFPIRRGPDERDNDSPGRGVEGHVGIRNLRHARHQRQIVEAGDKPAGR